MVTQLGCASVFWQTLGGTVVGNVTAGVMKDKIDENADEKKVKPECQASPK